MCWPPASALTWSPAAARTNPVGAQKLPMFQTNAEDNLGETNRFVKCPLNGPSNGREASGILGGKNLLVEESKELDPPLPREGLHDPTAPLCGGFSCLLQPLSQTTPCFPSWCFFLSREIGRQGFAPGEKQASPGPVYLNQQAPLHPFLDIHPLMGGP